jgi:transketolase
MTNRQLRANAIRVLSMDAVERAKSGHPGAPMGMADIAEVLWHDILKHNPSNPKWLNRDRFVLSNGHGSMLLYALLHLSGYDLTIDDLKNFRQLHSKTPGHPEYGYTPGVETTTGPLGQGLANAVGMALAEKNLAASFNREEHRIVDHFTYAFVGDGCLMEGISHEVCSLAGMLSLGKLIVVWDDNGISIDGDVKGWWRDDTPARFEAYGWQVIQDVQGHDNASILAAFQAAQTDLTRPTLICAKTNIGQGAPNKAGSHACHGAPLGEAEIQATREALGWTHAPFEIPQSVYNSWRAVEQGQAAEAAWQQQFSAYEDAFPELAIELKRRMAKTKPEGWVQTAQEYIHGLQAEPKALASRQASQQALECFGAMMPELIGGSADLAPSNLTQWSGSKTVLDTDASGNYIHYGVREFGMTAMANGMGLYGGLIPYTATFLIFMEYARNAVRMAALMQQQHIFVYTHDSIGLGEDGPTHQPIEQLTALRSTPNLTTWRPCDQVETAVAWKLALEQVNGPTSLVLSRQSLTQQPRTPAQVNNIERGGYILKDCQQLPDVILVATGSEVQLAVQAAEQLTQQGLLVNVVSMASSDVFDVQDHEYQAQVLPPQVTCRVAIEAGAADFWYKYVGLQGAVIGMNSFGESAPASTLFEHFGFTVANVVEQVLVLLPEEVSYLEG